MTGGGGEVRGGAVQPSMMGAAWWWWSYGGCNVTCDGRCRLLQKPFRQLSHLRRRSAFLPPTVECPVVTRHTQMF